LPEGGYDSVECGLIVPTADEVSEELLDLRDLLVEMLSAFSEGERDFALVGRGWDALDEFGMDHAIDETARAASFTDETFSNFDQRERLCFMKDGEHFSLGRGKTQRANLLGEETRAFPLCSQDQVT
jgi:hypothetical protein